MMIRKNLLLEVVQLVRQCDCQVLERCSCSKGIGKCCPNPRVSEKEKLRCVHSAFRHDFSHNEVLLENKVFLHAIRIYSIYIYIIFIYIYKCQYTNKKVSPKLIEEAFRQITLQVRKEEGWQGSIHWTKRLSILTKGCFPKMTVPTLSSLPASVAQNYSFRDSTDFREWIHGSLNLYITCSCWILAICL